VVEHIDFEARFVRDDARVRQYNENHLLNHQKLATAADEVRINFRPRVMRPSMNAAQIYIYANLYLYLSIYVEINKFKY
jgi:hypothetical protein